MTLPFGGKDGEPGAEVFSFSLFVVMCNRLVAASIAASTLALKGRYEELHPVAPIWAYAAVSLSNVVAITCQYEAFKYVIRRPNTRKMWQDVSGDGMGLGSCIILHNAVHARNNRVQSL